MKLKTGKEEIVYLLAKVFEQYELETGDLVIRNTNRKNYEAVSKKLSEISNELPNTAEIFGHDIYLSDYNPNQLTYPSRKYDITVSQVKDASLGLVNNPRAFLVDACYIYLFKIGRKGFEKKPQDERLLKNNDEITGKEAVPLAVEALSIKVAALEGEKNMLLVNTNRTLKKTKTKLWISIAILFAALLFAAYQWMVIKNEWNGFKNDMNIFPYKPTTAEIDSLEGVWLCYTGSPQARISDPNRFHQIVSNVVDIKYKNGYFTYNRYGANFNHTGYAQFEAPHLVSLHSHIKNNTGIIESPRHSLMQLDNGKYFLPVISASWSFDVGNRNNIIGIREVYVKQGKGGTIEEVINTIENASCKCKIVIWHQDNKNAKIFQVKNQILESLSDPTLKTLLDENSIILRQPQKGLILSADTLPKK